MKYLINLLLFSVVLSIFLPLFSSFSQDPKDLENQLIETIVEMERVSNIGDQTLPPYDPLLCEKVNIDEDVLLDDELLKRLSTPSKILAGQMLAFFRENFDSFDLQKFAQTGKDLQSGPLKDYLGRVKANFQAVGDLRIEKDGKYLPFLKEPLLPIFEMKEEEFNRMGSSDRYAKISRAVYQYLSDPEREGLGPLIKNYLQQLGIKDPKFSEFLEKITSFTDKSLWNKLMVDYPEYAPKMFFRVPIRNAERVTIGQKYILRKEILEPMEFSFAPLGVMKGISQKYDGMESFKGHTSAIPTGDLQLWIVAEKDPSWSNDARAETVLKRMATTFLGKNIFYSTMNVSPNFHPPVIKLFESPERKMIPDSSLPSERVFTIKETNGAEHGSTAVSIFRQEEAIKTLTHEFHHDIGAENPFKNYDVDEGSGQWESLGNWVLANFAIERMDKGAVPLLTESLTEALALVGHIGITSLEMTQGGNKDGDEWKKFKDLWNLEKSFSLFQAAKLLHLAGFDTLEEFLSPKDHQKRFKETTSTAEYYILKTLLIYDTGAFLNSVMKDGVSPKKDNGVIREELKALIMENSKNPSLKESINTLMDVFKRKMKEGGEGARELREGLLFQNQRMTLVELYTRPFPGTDSSIDSLQ